MTNRGNPRNGNRPTPVDTGVDNRGDRAARLSAVQRSINGELVALDDRRSATVTGHLVHRPDHEAIVLDLPQRHRRGRFSILAAVLITIAAQAVLGAAIAIQTVPPLIGAATAAGLAICGLILITAEAIAVASQRGQS